VSIKRVPQLAMAAGAVFLLAGCFGNGNHPVGVKGTAVRPGLYTTALPLGSNCVVKREQSGVPGFVGEMTQTSGRAFVQVLTTDTGIFSSGCGFWKHPGIASYNPNRATAKNGAYRIPTDLLPGTYTAPGGTGCTWQRLANFDWNGASIVAQNLNPGANPQVTIASTDAGFRTSLGCGGWKRIG
jgi:hypothetical protein